MKKIALAIENFSKSGGGAESYAVRLAQALIDDGWEVHCYGKKWDEEPPEAIFHKIAIPKYLPTWLQILLFALKHKAAVQEESYDIVLGFGNTIEMNVYQSHGGVHWLSTFRKSYSEPNSVLRKLKKALIVLTPKNHIRHWIESAPFRKQRLPQIIAISEMIKNDFINYYKVAPQSVELIYNGIDVTNFNTELLPSHRSDSRKKLGVKEHQTAFLFVSYELRKKGIEPLVLAAAKLTQKFKGQFKVIVVGAHPYTKLSGLIEKHGLSESFVFTGPCRSILSMYAAADVFILPTFYDACSLVVLEAMACGLPSITTETNGISGIIQDGENGCTLSHPPVPGEICAKMALLMDIGKRKKMGKKSRELAVSFTEKRNHQKMLAVINEQALKLSS